MARQYVVLSAFCLLLSIVAAAQMSSPNPGIHSDPNSRIGAMYSGAGGVLIVSVRDEKEANLDRQAVVKLVDQNRQKTTWQATSENSDTTFIDLTLGKYDVEVSAFGYLPEHKLVDVLSLDHSNSTQIILKRDPNAIDFNASSETLPAKASKERKRAISSLSTGKLKDAQKHLDAAYSVVPSSAYLNFLMGYLAFEQQNLQGAQTYLEKAITLDPHNAQALTLLGRVYLQEAENAKAQAVLQRAVATDAENWMAHNLLADAYLRQNDYSNALTQADLAIQGGKAGSIAAQIIRGEALASTGRDQEAIQAFNAYLQNAPDSPTAGSRPDRRC